MNVTQTILVIVISLLTLLLVVVGIQVLLVIVDLRKSIKRLNSILEDSLIGGGLIKPEKLTGVLKMFMKNKRLHETKQGNV